MFRWSLMLWKLFPSLAQRWFRKGQQFKWFCKRPQARRAKASVRLHLEGLHERIVPSVSTTTVQPMAEAATQMFTMMEQRAQLIVTAEQDLINFRDALIQYYVREIAYFQPQWGQLLGITPPTSGSGSGSGAMTTTLNTSSNQPLTSSTQKSGSGSGSGSSATANDNAPQPGGMKMQPLTGSGSGSNASPVTITGRVWLDSNGDLLLDNNELGFPGTNAEPTQVNLYNVSTGDLLQQIRPESDGSFKFSYTPPPGSGATEYQVAVSIQQYYYADEGGNSQIDSSGYYPEFSLAPGGSKDVGLAGLRSMNVNTTADDANALIQNMTTLRDAIETGNNGPPAPAITFDGSLSGTITLQAALPAIKADYDIDGPGASTLAVSGANSFRVFTVNATSTIGGLTIENGNAQSGGGIFNSGTLTLSNDSVVNNSTPNGGNGGGIFNTKGTLTVNSTNVTKNQTAPQGVQGGLGGGLYNVGGGLVKISASEFYNNRASNGGGIFNRSGGVKGCTVDIKGGTTIDYNIVTGGGGGVDNSSGTVSMSSGSIYENSSGAGGGIYTVGGSMTLWHVYLYANFAQTGNGGGVLENQGNVTLFGGTAQGNTANNGMGGGLYVMNGKLFLRGGELIGGGNTAITGGGLYLAGGITNFTGCTVSGNSATKQAAGIAYTTNAALNPKPPIPPANLTDNDDPGGQPVLV